MFNQFMFHRMWFFDKDEGGGTGSASDGTSTEDADTKTEDEKFAEWLATQPKDLRDQFEAHTTGLLSALKKERKNASDVPQLRAKVKEFETAAEKATREQNTEKDNLVLDLGKSQATATSLQAENTELRIQMAVEREAAKLSFIDPAEALALLPKDAIKVGEDKVVTGVVEAIKELAAKKPHLLKVPEKPKGPGTRTTQGEKSAGSGDEKPGTLKAPARARL